MPDQADVRSIALSLPGTSEAEERFAFYVERGARRREFVWVWLERVHPKRARVAQRPVVAVRVANLDEKDSLLAMGNPALFTEPHYNGYPAVLIRLQAIALDELEDLIIDAWRCQAPPRLVAAFDAHEGN